MVNVFVIVIFVFYLVVVTSDPVLRHGFNFSFSFSFSFLLPDTESNRVELSIYLVGVALEFTRLILQEPHRTIIKRLWKNRIIRTVFSCAYNKNEVSDCATSCGCSLDDIGRIIRNVRLCKCCISHISS